MGRRQRRRAAGPQTTTRPPATRIARVRVDEETWADFKQAIGDRSVAEVLGRYVETEVARAQRDAVKHAGITERELVDALERAEALTATLQDVTGRLRGLRGIWT